MGAIPANATEPRFRRHHVNKILAAVDDTPRAGNVLDMALQVATRLDAQVHLFRVVPPPPVLTFVGRDSPERDEEELLAAAKRNLEALVQGSREPARVVIEPPLLDAHEPWRVILGEAQRLGVGLIVIGSHGFHGWDRLFGTVTGKVAEHADRHVLVVHSKTSTGQIRTGAP
jgi:universal stress protein A